MDLGISLNRLLVFVTLAEVRSFRECARRMKRTQPSISRQIRELEQELRQTLFVRDSHRVELTAEGRKLLARVGTPVHLIAQAVDQSESKEGTLSGRLRFGAFSEVGQAVLFEYVMRFCRESPGVVPEVRYEEERDIREQLRKGEIDFGILSHAFESETLRSHRLLTERIILIGRKGLEVPDRTQVRLPVIGYRDEDPLIELFEKKFCRRKELPCRTVCMVNSHRSMIEALGVLDAFAYMPALSARRQLASGELREIAGFTIEQTLFLGYAVQEHESALRKKFREYLLKRCRAELR